MKIIRFILLSATVSVLPALALAEQFEGFKQNVTEVALKAFARDIGGLVGGGTFHSGSSLGFPGVDFGVHMNGQSSPSNDDVILKDLTGKTVKNAIIPVAQGAIGLPYNIDVIMRGISFGDTAMVGSGLRYGLFKAKLLPMTPAMSISAFTHVLNHNYFSMTHYSANASFDINVPVVSPYIGVGWDHSRIKVKDAADLTLVGLKVKANGTRAVAGINFKPFPLCYVNAAYANLHGESGYEAGMGLKF